MNLNRGLIKQQAKQLNKNNTIKLFAISFVILLVMELATGGINIYTNVRNFLNNGSPFSSFRDDYNHYLDDYFDDYNDFDFDDDFNSFGNDFDFDDDYAQDFNNFGKDMDEFDFDGFINNGLKNQNAVTYNFTYKKDPASLFINIIQLLLAPLAVSLAGYYLMFIRGGKVDVTEGVSSVFKNTFNNTYGKKLLLVFLRRLFTTLLCFLLIIPGIVYYYSTYFASQIMADNPDMSPSQALQLSKKMVKGNRWELFVLDLSFIPWYILCVFLFPIIYVIPYKLTTVALFYENFRIRALQQGRITEDDFLSDEQRYSKYANVYTNQNGENNYQQGGYQPYGQPNYYQPPQNSYYNSPQQTDYAQPQQQENPVTEETAYSPEPAPADTVSEPETPAKDPWEINHED